MAGRSLTTKDESTVGFVRATALVGVLGCALLLAAGAALAFTHRLSSEEVRAAFFLGQNVDDRKEFFDQYIHLLKVHDTGMDVHVIEFRTPYELVALRAQEHWANYNALDADDDYAKHPDQVVIRVLICDTPMFPFPQKPFLAPGKPAPRNPDDFFRDFKFRVSQAAPIEPEKRTGSSAMACFGAAVEALLYFKADQFAAGDVKIEVTEPYGNTYQTTFDLDQLK